MFLFVILVGILSVLFLIFLYFLPSFVACSRGHHNCAAIFVLNLFLGWSFFGWVIALTWAMTRVQYQDARVRVPA